MIEEEAKTGRKERKSSSKKSSSEKSSSKRGDDATGQVWWYDGKEKKTSHSAPPTVPTTPPEISGEVDVDEKEGAAVDYYEYEAVDPATKARELREVEAERLASSVSSSSRKTGKGHSAALAAARAKLNKVPPPTMYPSPPPPEPPDYSDIIEAASLAMNEGVGIHSAGDADEAHRQRDSPDGERDRGEQVQPPVRGVQSAGCDVRGEETASPRGAD